MLACASATMLGDSRVALDSCTGAPLNLETKASEQSRRISPRFLHSGPLRCWKLSSRQQLEIMATGSRYLGLGCPPSFEIESCSGCPWLFSSNLLDSTMRSSLALSKYFRTFCHCNTGQSPCSKYSRLDVPYCKHAVKPLKAYIEILMYFSAR